MRDGNPIDGAAVIAQEPRVDTVGPSPRPSPPSTGERESAPRPSAVPWLSIALLMSLLFWASAFAAIRVGLRAYSPQSLAFLRFITA